MRFSFAYCVAAAACIYVQADDSPKLVTKRKVDIKYTGSQISIDAKAEDESSKDVLKFFMNAEGRYFDSVFDFKSKDNSGAIKEVQNRISARLIRIVEFRNSGGGFVAGDSVHSMYPIPDKDGKYEWKWAPLSFATEGKTHEFAVTTQDGIVTVFGTYVEDTIFANETTGPNEIKLDFRIQNYPYKQVGSGSKLALECAVKSKSKLQTQGIEDGSNVVRTLVDHSAAQGLFSWITEADADGSTVEILATKGDVDNEGPGIYFTIEDTSQPRQIIWDPTLGLETHTSWWTTGKIISVILCGTVLIALLAFCVVKRPCKRGAEASVAV